MNQSELVSNIAHDTGVTKTDVEKTLKGLGVVVHQALAHSHEVTLPGICKISSTLRAGRMGKNPRTGEAIEIQAKHVPKIVVLKALKDAAAVEL